MNSASTNSTTAGSVTRRRKSPARKARDKSKLIAAAKVAARWLFFIVAAWLILVAIVILLARAGLPWLSSYKGDIETRLSEQLNTPVAIDELTVRWAGFGPKLSATGISLAESDERQATLDEVLIDMNIWKTITHRAPALDELKLVGAKLTLERSDEGKFELHGLKPSSDAPSKPNQNLNALKRLLDNGRLALQDSTLTLIDAKSQRQLAVSDVNIFGTNDGDVYQVRLDMQLPAELGGRIEAGLDLHDYRENIRDASADLHLIAKELRADAWRSLQSGKMDDSATSTTGIARLDASITTEIWGSVVDGRLETARGQLSIVDVVDLKSQERVLDSVSTDVVFESMDAGWRLAADALMLENEGESIVVNDVVYHYRPEDNVAWQLNANGKSLELDLATKMALSLFDKDAELPRAKWLADASPRGDLYNWNVAFALTDGRPDFSLFTIFHELELTAAAGIPGTKNIGGTIDMQHNVGTISMQGVDMELDMPSLYDTPLKLQKLYGELDIDVRDPVRTSLKGDVVIDDRGLDVNTRLEVNLIPGSLPHIDAQGKFSLNDLGRAREYIPFGVIGPGLGKWLDTSLIAGEALNGELLLFGNVGDFPFSENEGVFKAGFDIKDGTLAYVDDWPLATGLQGRFDMEGASIRGQAWDGKVDAVRASNVDVRINDVLDAVLDIETTSSGSLPKMVEFANTGPLKSILEPALKDIKAKGNAQMDLNLIVPLNTTPKVNTVASAQASVAAGTTAQASGKSGVIPGLEVNGSIFLRNNELQFDPAKLDLSNVDGTIGFTEDGIRLDNLQASLFGKKVRVDGKTEGPDDNRIVELTVNGTARTETALDNYEIPLTRFAQGESRWDVSVRVPMNADQLARNGIRVAATSDLVGTRLILPAPLTKFSARAERINLSTTVFPDSAEAQWLIEYGPAVKSLVRVDDEGLRSLTMNFGGGAPNPNVEDGLRFEGTMSQLGLDGWVQSIAQLLDDLPEAETPTPILPISGHLRVNQMIAGRQSVGRGSLRFNTDENYINTVIESPWLSGNARYPREHWTKTRAALVRLSRVDKRFIDALDTAEESEEESDELDPTELPPLEIRVSQLKWDLLDLTNLTIRTSPAVSGMSIDTFGFAYESAQLIGTGYWRLRDSQGVNNALKDQHVTKLDLTMLSSDFGRTVTELGFEGTLSAGEGELTGSLVWPEPAYKPSLENMVGEMNIEMRKGRILKVEPGAAKLVGLFDFESIPRRLSLDFSDLVLDGLEYESIRGDVQLANGIAHVPLLQYNGSVGVVDVVGESNLITQQYNQRITVLPRVSAALPIIGIISGGATAGIGALFAGGILKAIGLDFDRIGLRQYALTGGWDNPDLSAVPYSP